MSRKQNAFRGLPSEEQIARKLGDDLARQQGKVARELIISRGGSGANVQEAGPWADRTLRETVLGALQNAKDAEKLSKL